MNIEALRMAYALTCFGPEVGQNITTIPDSVMTCVRDTSDVPTCINRHFQLPPNEQLTALTGLGDADAQRTCRSIYVLGTTAIQRGRFRESFQRDAESRAILSQDLTTPSDATTLAIDNEISFFANQLPTIAEVATHFANHPPFARRLRRYQATPFQATAPSLAPRETLPTPACHNTSRWTSYDLNIPGFRRPVAVILPRNDASSWGNIREQLLFAFEAAKLFISPTDFEAILHPGEGIPDFSIVYPQRSESNPGDPCGDQTPGRVANGFMHYEPEENRLHIGASQINMLSSRSPNGVQDVQQYYPDRALYSFLNGLGQAFYSILIADDTTTRTALTAHFRWTAQSVTPFMRPAPIRSHDIGSFNNPNWGQLIPLFSESIGLGDADNDQPRALLNIQNWAGDLFAEMALLELINSWRERSHQLNLRSGHLGARIDLSRNLFRPPPSEDSHITPYLIGSFYSRRDLDIDLEPHRYPHRSISLGANVGLDFFGNILATGEAHYGRLRTDNIGLNLGAYGGLYGTAAQFGLQASASIRFSSLVGAEIPISTGVLVEEGHVYPNIQLGTRFYLYPHGDSSHPTLAGFSYYFSTSVRFFFHAPPIPIVGAGISVPIELP